VKRRDEFIGNDFHWFIGEVLDIDDDKLFSRVKVRAYGYYDEDVPTEDLPWATVLLPNTSASKAGVGSTHALLVGSWVVGFFRDGYSAWRKCVRYSFFTYSSFAKRRNCILCKTIRLHNTDGYFMYRSCAQ